MLIWLLAMCVSIISLNDITKEKRTRVKEINMDIKELNQIIAEKEILKNQINEMEKSNDR